ncbi:putative phenylalanine--tRNA ligase alpha subunit [Capsicum annuum]|nr:putative phenylalanine--tRNA ligase alpha subunit [Capsicum annuum]
MAEEAEDAILGYLKDNDEISNSANFAEEFGFSHDEILNVIRRLNGFRFVEAQDYLLKSESAISQHSVQLIYDRVTWYMLLVGGGRYPVDLVEDIRKERWVLTEEGKTYAAVGSPEFQLFSAVPTEGIAPEELQKKLGPAVYKIGCQQAIKNKWVQMAKAQVSRKVEHADDKVKDLLLRIQKDEVVNQEDIDALKRRKLIIQQIWKGNSVRKGPEYAPKRKRAATDLTRENLQRFEEMPTNNYVESSFWNFDALFQPQQHPARDSHDTFFLKVPSTTRMLPEDYVERVKEIHESGGYQSRGYGYDWKREEANKNLLRTHTTAVSSRMLYALAQKPFAPKKYYSIDRVFRNEAVDRTHLAEFHQIEGLICDRGLTLGDLIGVLHDFFSRLGMSKLRFKPAYNPYTEPSMEIFSYHEGFKKWVEVGNSGMFRPEMLLPMGLPEDVRVIAWGLSLESLQRLLVFWLQFGAAVICRTWPTMILYGIDNIRDLFGPKVDLGLIKRNPICRLGL